MDIPDPKVTIQVPLSEAPWMEEHNPPRVIHNVTPGRKPFQFWMTSSPPTQPNYELWFTYPIPKEWTEALASGVIHYKERKPELVDKIHHYPWPYVLNHNILKLRWLVERGAWNDIRQIDGIHNCVYSLQRAPRYGQLITVYSVFRRLYVDIK